MEKFLIIVLIIIFIGGIFFLGTLSVEGNKYLEIVSPIGGENLSIEEEYQIKWIAKNIDKVGIVLFDGIEPKWIAKDIKASLGSYTWNIQPGQRYGDDYWMAIFEYPYSENSKIDYSKGSFSLTYVDIVSCDKISVSEERPYIPISFPETRRVFVTEGLYSGNLEGLTGASEICNNEAEKLGYGGNWIAFLGGERLVDTAKERILKSSKGEKGVFIEANPNGEISRGDSCHRLISKDFNEFLNLFSDGGKSINSSLEDSLVSKFKNLWLGRVTEEEKTNCIEIITPGRRIIPENYSFTVSCQNWTSEKRTVTGDVEERNLFNPGNNNIEIEEGSLYSNEGFPICYTNQGVAIEAKGVGSFSLMELEENLILAGSRCDEKKHIICIED